MDIVLYLTDTSEVFLQILVSEWLNCKFRRVLTRSLIETYTSMKIMEFQYNIAGDFSNYRI